MELRVAILLSMLASAGCADVLGIDDGIPRGDAGANTPDTFSPLQCGASTCDFAAGESCCVGNGGSGPTCIGPNDDCATLFVPCDRSSQCPQDDEAGPVVCCADYAMTDAGNVAFAVSCVAKTDCNAQNLEVPLCGGGATDCSGDASCGASTVALPGFSICLGDGVQ